ncbi:Vacuolar protein sorting-associated protein 54 [Phytophthora pseudosyringae]|uniref:Vacuolar protein sorting-associated protein 54 n=1 Tax=Phytophthora pseudosyringae TaxID=221518 RepID=A0A8T1WAK8_9STRA|nr:Vacuolar protein sorting-associated protein 54 [Phytophthora pseudosyringae]
MEAPERHPRRSPVPSLLVLGWWVAVSLHLCRALNCALPQPLLVGIQNATAVQLPVDVELTTTSASAGASSDLIFVATHNARNIPWNQKITIDTPGRHRVLAIVASPISVCSRTDFFVFDGYLSPESNAKTEDPPALGCQLTPELHLLIFWSAMPDDDFSRLLRAMTALSDITSYPETDYHLRLRGVFRADLGVGHRINENWYREFYGKTYYSLYFGTPDRVDMVYVKGDGAFHVALVEDLCPKYAYDLKREMVLNTNMFALKNLLREQSSQWYQVHTTQTRQESDADYNFLFGETGREIFHSLRLDHLWPAVTYEGLRVANGIYIVPWRRVFIAIDAMEVLGAMMQSEWYRFDLDVPEIHAELTPGMLDPDPTSSQENIHRAAFLGSSRLPLLAHLPTDSLWYKGRLELKSVKEFRVLKENTWGQQLPPCSTVGDAAALLSSQDVAVMPEEGSLRDHVRQLQQRVEHFNHTVIVVGASIDGPFTIWDGNHRAIALVLTQPDSHLLLVYVGVSSKFTSPHRGSLFCP